VNRRSPDAGVTLVETLVAMALFALIGLAGFAIVDSVLRVQARTETRLDALESLQRAMLLLTTDIEQLADGAMVFEGDALSLARRGAGAGAGAGAQARAQDDVTVRYALGQDALVRTVTDPFGATRTNQRLVDGIDALTWRFYAPETGWIDLWPPEDGPPGLPRAVEATLRLAPDRQGPAGMLRRVAVLPDGAGP